MTQTDKDYFYKYGQKYRLPTYDYLKEAKDATELGWYWHHPTKCFYKWKDLPKDK